MKDFYIYDLSILLSMQSVLTVPMQRSWWSSGMISEKVTWDQFPARISTAYSKILQFNDLVFFFLNLSHFLRFLKCI